VAGAAPDASTGEAVLFGNVTSGSVVLDARQTTAGDDPGTVGLTEGACASGALEYQWSQIDDYGQGTPGTLLQPFSPDATVSVSPSSDATYRVEVRCSSDSACMAVQDVHLLAYTGDGNDLATETYAGSPLGIFDGLFITHDPITNEATLSWAARPQPQGVSGYNIWKASVASANTDLFPGDVFIGGGAGSAFCGIANGATGTRRTQVETVMPAVGSASLYMIGHRSLNAMQAPSPLGNRPSSSVDAGTLVFSKATCP